MKLQLVSLLTSILVPLFLNAEQVAINTNPLTAEIRQREILITPGSSKSLTVHLKLAKGYHAYVDRFKLSIVDPTEVTVGDVKLSPIVSFSDPLSKGNKSGVKDKAELTAEIKVPGGLGSGVIPLKFSLGYQACTEEHCLFPKTVELTTLLNTSGVKGTTAPLEMPEKDKSSKVSQNEFSDALEKGLLSALALAFLVGLATSFTPCIYPMIPITLAVLGARKNQQSHLRGFLIALTYVLGIALTYSILGLIAASTGGAFGRLLGNTTAITFIAGVFVLMGLSMYGFIDIQIPNFIQTRLGFAHKSTGFAGAFGAGLAAGIVASPCVGPVLISILTYIAQTKNLFFGFIYLFVFAFGIGFPFLILGTFSQLIGRIPKAGPWMEFVKFAFGTVMIGVALFYIEPVYPKWLYHVLLGASLIFISSVYGAFENVGNIKVDPESSITKGAFSRIRKGVMIAVLVTGTAFLAHGLMSRAGIRFAATENGAATSDKSHSAGLPFEVFSMEKLYVAQKEKKPVLIDFYADWCAACKELEEYTFTDERVRDLGKDFVLLRFDATEDNAEVTAILKEFNVIGLPTLVFFDRNGEQRDDQRVTGFENADRFLERLKIIAK